jgi:hypothetical protein
MTTGTCVVEVSSAGDEDAVGALAPGLSRLSVFALAGVDDRQ